MCHDSCQRETFQNCETPRTCLDLSLRIGSSKKVWGNDGYTGFQNVDISQNVCVIYPDRNASAGAAGAAGAAGTSVA